MLLHKQFNKQVSKICCIMKQKKTGLPEPVIFDFSSSYYGSGQISAPAPAPTPTPTPSPTHTPCGSGSATLSLMQQFLKMVLEKVVSEPVLRIRNDFVPDPDPAFNFPSSGSGSRQKFQIHADPDPTYIN